MKPFRLLREEMEERRIREGKTVEIFLNQPYKVKPADRRKLIEEHEVAGVNERIEAMQALLADPSQVHEMKRRSEEMKKEFFDSISFGQRISVLLLRAAMDMRYRVKTPMGERVEMPRKTADKASPGKWWGVINDRLDDYPETIDLPIVQVQWLVAVWFDEKVQNGFPAEFQTWANIFEAEMERLQAELESK